MTINVDTDKIDKECELNRSYSCCGYCDINPTIFGTKVGVNINLTIRDTFDCKSNKID